MDDVSTRKTTHHEHSTASSHLSLSLFHFLSSSPRHTLYLDLISVWYPKTTSSPSAPPSAAGSEPPFLLFFLPSSSPSTLNDCIHPIRVFSPLLFFLSLSLLSPFSPFSFPIVLYTSHTHQYPHHVSLSYPSHTYSHTHTLSLSLSLSLLIEVSQLSLTLLLSHRADDPNRHHNPNHRISQNPARVRLGLRLGLRDRWRWRWRRWQIRKR